MLRTRSGDYDALLSKVGKILSEGKERARLALELERVRTYWKASGVLRTHLRGKDSGYGKHVVERLSIDTNLSLSVIYDMVQLRERFVNLPAQGELGWSHCRRLLPVENDALRKHYLQEAVSRDLSLKELDAAIKSDPRISGSAKGGVRVAKARTRSKGRLSPKRGDLYLYRVKKKKGRLVLDLGLSKSRRLRSAAAKGLKPGDTVRSIRDDAAPGGYRYRKVKTRKRFYSYLAEIERVIDGDTVLATLDLGFEYETEEKLRLRAIDTPEMKTAGGQRAKDRLGELLRGSTEVVVTTTKTDLYGRYLSDLFVLPGEEDMQKVADEGRFVNRELVDEGFARLWIAGKRKS